jgi:integrase
MGSTNMTKANGSMSNLTDAIAGILEPPPGKSEIFLWDDSLPGFGVRARRSDAEVSRAWYVQYRVAGKQRRESLGDIRRIKLDAVRKIARKRFAQVELGQDPVADRKRARAEAAVVKLTIRTVISRYLRAKKMLLRPSSYKAAARYFEMHWGPLHEVPIADANLKATAAALVQDMVAERGPISAARALDNLCAMVGWAEGQGLVDKNVIASIPKPDANVLPRERVLSDVELRTVWQHLGDDDFGKIVKLLVLLGCRRAEIGELRWSELDFEAGAVTISSERTKNARTLSLTLPPLAIEILRSVPRREGPCVFGKGGRGFRGWGYSKLALDSRITNALGRSLESWTPHDLRRTCRSGLGRVGVRPDVAELVIGHSKKGIVAVYDKYSYAGEVAQALLRWSEYVDSVVEDRPGKIVPMRGGI